MVYNLYFNSDMYFSVPPPFQHSGGEGPNEDEAEMIGQSFLSGMRGDH